MVMEPRTGIAPRLAAEIGAVDAVAPVSPTAGRLDHVAALTERRDRDMGELVRTLVAVSGEEGLADLTGGCRGPRRQRSAGLLAPSGST